MRTWLLAPAMRSATALLLASAFGPGPIGAQEEPEIRVLAVVDYVSGNEIYLAAGSDHGLRVGDTLPVYDGEGQGAEFLGVLAIISANERRSVATFAETPFTISRAESGRCPARVFPGTGQFSVRHTDCEEPEEIVSVGEMRRLIQSKESECRF